MLGKSTTAKILKLASFGIVDQKPLITPIAIVLACINLIQGFFLIFEATCISFPSTSSGLEKVIVFISRLFLGRHKVDIDSFEPYQIVILALILLYLLLHMSILAISLRLFLKIKPIPLWIRQNWKNLAHIHLYALFLPIHNILLDIIIQALTDKPHKSIYYVMMAFAIVLEIANLVLCGLQFYVSITFKTADPLSTSNDNFLKIDFLIKIAMSIVNLLLQELYSMSTVVLNLVYLFLGIIHTGVFLFTVPFLTKEIFTVFQLSSTIWISFTVNNFLISIFDHKPAIKFNVLYALVILLLIIPLTFKFYQSFIQSRMTKALYAAIDYLAGSCSVPMPTLNRSWLIQSFYRLKGELESKISANVLSNSYPEHLITKLGYHRHLSHIFFKREAKYLSLNNQPLDIKIFLIRMMESWLRRNPQDHLIKLILAEFMVKDFGLVCEPYLLSQNVMKIGPNINLRLSALKIRENIQGTIKSYNKKNTHFDLSLFFKGPEIYNELTKKIAFQVEDSHNFYKTIQEKEPDLVSVIESAKTIIQRKTEILQFCESFPKDLLEAYITLLLVYGIYKITVNFEYEEGKNLLERYQNFVKKRFHLKNNFEIDEETLYSENNIIFLISTSKSEFGSIVSCGGENVTKLFGEKAYTLIGKNIKTLMPPFFQKIHDGFIKKKLKTSANILPSKTFMTFAKDNQGFIFPINLLTVLFPFINRGFFFSGIIRPIFSQLNYILLTEDSVIDSFSKGIKDKLGLPSPLEGRRVKITHICKSFDAINKAIAAVIIKKHDRHYPEDSAISMDLASTHALTKNHEKSQEELESISKDAAGSSHYSHSEKSKKKSYSSADHSSQQVQEMEALVNEITIKGKVLHFTMYHQSGKQGDETTVSRKSYRGTLFSERLAMFNPNKATLASLGTEPSSFAHTTPKKFIYFHCRVEIKQYNNKFLKVLTLNEVNGPPAEENGFLSTTKNVSPKRYSLRRHVIPFVSQKGLQKQEEENPITPSFDRRVIRPSKIDTSPRKSARVEALQRVIEISSEEASSKTSSNASGTESSDTGSSDESSSSSSTQRFRNSQEKLKSPVLKHQISNQSSKDMKSIEGSDNSNHSTSKIAMGSEKTDKSGSHMSDYMNNDNELMPDISRKSRLGTIPIDFTNQRRRSVMISNSLMNPFVKPHHKKQEHVGSNKGSQQSHMKEENNALQNTIAILAKEEANSKCLDLSKFLSTLKFYKFTQAKVPLFGPIACSVALVVSSLLILVLATHQLPLIQTVINIIVGNLDRMVYLSAITRNTIDISFFATNSALFGYLLAGSQASLRSAATSFNSENTRLSDHLGLFSDDFKAYLFKKDFKILIQNYADFDNPSNFMLVDHFDASDLLTSHAAHVAGAQNFTDASFLYSVEFIFQNIYGSILKHSSEQPNLLMDELNDRVESTKRSSNLVFVILGCSFLVGTAAMLVVYFKLFAQTRDFLKYFLHYNATEVGNITYNMNCFKRLLDLAIQDEGLVSQFKVREHFYGSANLRLEKEKRVKTGKLAFTIYRNVSGLCLLFLVPFGCLFAIQDLFQENFQTITPEIQDTVAIRNIALRQSLTWTKTALYHIRQTMYINGEPIASVVEDEVDTLAKIIQKSSLNDKLEDFPILHFDFCDYVVDGSACRACFDGISTAGFTGSVLVLQDFLKKWKKSIDDGDTSFSSYIVSPPYPVDNANNIQAYSFEASEKFTSERVDNLLDNLDKMQDSLIMWTVLSVVLSLAIVMMVTHFIYKPLKQQRQIVCKILLLFPFRFIILNKPLKAFLARESKQLNEIFKSRHQY